jgi:hypothetical protein
MMLLEKLQNKLQTEKFNYRWALRNKKEWQQRKTHYIELGIYIGSDKEYIDNHLRMVNNDIYIYRTRAFDMLKKVSIVKRLIGGNIDNSTTAYNDVVKIPLTVENDFSQANKILDSGDVTSGYDSEYYYNERVENSFVGTYPIKIERHKDYEKFINALLDDAVLNNINVDFSITFEEWKSGYIQDGKRQTKINKFLRKKGFSQYVLDFYSQQIKTEKTLYITVSDRVQHIAGMSYFSTGQWDGMGGSSCQDPRNEYSECVRLLASLHDDKLLVTFLHENIEDLEDMKEKMLARSVARIIHVDGKQFLITTRHYGNNETKDMLENGLRQLNKYNIFTSLQMENGDYRHKEDTNGYVYITESDEVNVYETIDEYIDVECPMCNGSGEYGVYDRNDNYHDITCPACHGHGTVEVNVYIDIDEYIDVETEHELTPYDENYNHYGHYMAIYIDKKVLGLE